MTNPQRAIRDGIILILLALVCCYCCIVKICNTVLTVEMIRAGAPIIKKPIK